PKVDVMSFFFSSRRRHTSFSRDWSSDVCSSDLFCVVNAPFYELEKVCLWLEFEIYSVHHAYYAKGKTIGYENIDIDEFMARRKRSEERRVGKEYRSRSTRYRQTKKNIIELL